MLFIEERGQVDVQQILDRGVRVLDVKYTDNFNNSYGWKVVYYDRSSKLCMTTVSAIYIETDPSINTSYFFTSKTTGELCLVLKLTPDIHTFI